MSFPIAAIHLMNQQTIKNFKDRQGNGGFEPDNSFIIIMIIICIIAFLNLILN